MNYEILNKRSFDRVFLLCSNKREYSSTLISRLLQYINEVPNKREYLRNGNYPRYMFKICYCIFHRNKLINTNIYIKLGN